MVAVPPTPTSELSATITTAMHALELKVPPLALAVAFALAMWLAAAQAPVLAVELPAHRVIAALVASLGVALVRVSGLGFLRAETTHNAPTPPAATMPWRSQPSKALPPP